MLRNISALMWTLCCIAAHGEAQGTTEKESPTPLYIGGGPKSRSDPSHSLDSKSIAYKDAKFS